MINIYYKIVDYKYRSLYARSEFELTYKIGTIVEASPHTQGMMCFETLKDLQKFYFSIRFLSPQKVIALKALSNEVFPTFYNYNCGPDDIKLFYSRLAHMNHNLLIKLYSTQNTHKTVFFHKMRVIRELPTNWLHKREFRDLYRRL